MKELSEKEKAKRYDEALKKARYWEKNPTVWSSDDICQKLFPELAESEDERIRKDLIVYLRSILSNKKYGDKFIEGWIAWLEKQGKTSLIFSNSSNIGKDEQKPAFEMKTPEESLDIDSDTYSKIVDECVYGEQKPVEDRYMEGYLNGVNDASKTLKPTAWSEEDENRRLSTIEDLENVYEDTYNRHFSKFTSMDNRNAILKGIKENIDWLKSLKDRVQSQPKQEWSEEDKEIIDYLIDYLESELDSSYTDLDKETFTKEINLLKSLKPQKQWKPSDEQMDALESAVSSLQSTALESLYRNLKGYE